MPPPTEHFESKAGIGSLKHSPSSLQGKRGPASSMDEPARLTHLTTGPRMLFTLSTMYNKPESRAEINDQPENPSDGIISCTFNDNSFIVVGAPAAKCP